MQYQSSGERFNSQLLDKLYGNDELLWANSVIVHLMCVNTS